jgi:hypothetical protein
MPTTDRECRRGGQRFAIPTLGEVEGKLIASEIVASSCLLELSAYSSSKEMLSIRNRIRQALDARCTNASLCHEDTAAAAAYAFELLDANSQRTAAIGRNKGQRDMLVRQFAGVRPFKLRGAI